MVSEIEKRDLKQELMAHSIEHAPEAEAADHDQSVIGFIEGVVIVSARDVPRGRAWIVPRRDQDRNRLIAVH